MTQNVMWYRDSGTIIGDGFRNLLQKMKEDGFPKISPRRWTNYYPREWNGPVMHEWMEEARMECWPSRNRPSSSSAIEAILRHIMQTTRFATRLTPTRKNHLNAILMLRIAAIESGMMDEEVADEYFDMNLPQVG